MALEDAVGSPFEDGGVMYYPLKLEQLGTALRKAKAILTEERGIALAAMPWLTDEQRTEMMFAYQDKLDLESDVMKPSGQALLLQFVGSLDGLVCILDMCSRGQQPFIPLTDQEAFKNIIERVFKISGLSPGKKEVPPNRAARRARK